jgi:hypothetical protein
MELIEEKGDSSPTYFWATPCTKWKWEMNRLKRIKIDRKLEK